MKSRGTDVLLWVFLAVGVLIIVLVAFIARPAQGAEPVPMKLIPMWERKLCGCASGVESACYTFEQAKTLMKLDLDYQSTLEELAVTKKNLEDAKAAAAKLAEANTHLINATSVLDTRLTEKHKVLEETTLSFQQAQQRDILGGGFPWVVGIAVTFGVAGLITGVVISK